MTFRRVVIVGGVLAGAFGILWTLAVVSFLVDGDYVRGVGMSALAFLFLGCAVAARKVGSKDIAPHVVGDDGGTTFWPDRWIDVPVQVGFFGVVLNMAYQGVAVARGTVLTFLPTWAAVGVAMTCVACATALSVLLWPSFRWGASQRLRLTPVGIELASLGVHSYPWERFQGVTPAVTDAFWPTGRSIVLAASAKGPVLLRLNRFSPNGTAFGDLVEFYWQYPAARVELTDGGAARRLEQNLIRGRRVRQGQA